LPDRHNSEYSFQQTEKCKYLSDNFLKDHFSKPDVPLILVESKSHFNKRLNTCLLYYHINLYLGASSLDDSYVMDVLTGENLIEAHVRDGKESLARIERSKEASLTLSDFVTREKKLMSE